MMKITFFLVLLSQVVFASEIETKIDRLFSSGIADEGYDDENMRECSWRKPFRGFVAVSKQGRPLFENSYEVVGEDGIRRDELVPVASITKQIVGLGILLLEQRGYLKSTDLIGRHLPGLSQEVASLAIYELLSHRSGLSDRTIREEGLYCQSSEAVAQAMKKRLMMGEKRYSYANINYALLGKIIEAVSGKSLNLFFQENFFRPLKMNSTRFVYSKKEQVGASRGFRTDLDKCHRAEEEKIDFAAFCLYGSANVLSTAADLLKWSGVFKKEIILSQRSLKRLFGRPTSSNEYRYGLHVDIVDGRVRVSHGGTLSGFRHKMSFLPETGLTVLVLSNQGYNLHNSIDDVSIEVIEIANGSSL